ncbi:DUF2971 domain-containing protein [Rhodohalobacter barkolensis]|nr:DUF2971 domain-containing protein [Rhodohalobacter barkolensis]
MEGQYLYTGSSDGVNKDIQQILNNKKDRIRICSLSNNYQSPVMWSHYANGHRGVVLGVEIDPNKYNVRSIFYDGPMKINLNSLNTNSAIDILTTKLQAWKYEEEERVFTIDGSQFVDIDLKKIIFGSRMNTRDKGLIMDLVESICPEVIVEDSHIS